MLAENMNVQAVLGFKIINKQNILTILRCTANFLPVICHIIYSAYIPAEAYPLSRLHFKQLYHLYRFARGIFSYLSQTEKSVAAAKANSLGKL